MGIFFQNIEVENHPVSIRKLIQKFLCIKIEINVRLMKILMKRLVDLIQIENRFMAFNKIQAFVNDDSSCPTLQIRFSLKLSMCLKILQNALMRQSSA
jgi:hypothetical protein